MKVIAFKATGDKRFKKGQIVFVQILHANHISYTHKWRGKGGYKQGVMSLWNYKGDGLSKRIKNVFFICDIDNEFGTRHNIIPFDQQTWLNPKFVEEYIKQ